MAPPLPKKSAMGGAELVALVAGLMSLNALAIDIMLPALSAMAEDLELANPSHRQLVVIGFAMGMGFGQLFFGPLSDRYGRKPILLVSLALYAAFGAACNFAPNFETLVVLRVLQGVSSAGARSTSIAIVRDLYEGAAMARTMSLVMTMFMAVPIVAPSLGASILWMGLGWRWIFWCLVGFAALLGLWSSLRLNETLNPAHQRPIRPRALVSGYLEVLRHPQSRGYTLAMGAMFGSLMAFLGSSEQVFTHYGLQDTFPFWFAGLAVGMAAGSLVNARSVSLFGPVAVAHSALLGFMGVQVAYLSALGLGYTGFATFYVATGATMLCLSFVGANFNAIAMAPMGHLAGTAAALVGFASSSVSAWLGGAIGQAYVAEPWPFAVGNLILGMLALSSVLLAEQGVLYGQSAERLGPT